MSNTDWYSPFNGFIILILKWYLSFPCQNISGYCNVSYERCVSYIFVQLPSITCKHNIACFQVFINNQDCNFLYCWSVKCSFVCSSWSFICSDHDFVVIVCVPTPFWTAWLMYYAHKVIAADHGELLFSLLGWSLHID